MTQTFYTKKQKYSSKIKRVSQLKRFYVHCTLQLTFTCPETGGMYPGNPMS